MVWKFAGGSREPRLLLRETDLSVMDSLCPHHNPTHDSQAWKGGAAVDNHWDMGITFYHGHFPWRKQPLGHQRRKLISSAPLDGEHSEACSWQGKAWK